MALRIIVVGYIVRAPLGGMAWHYAQYVLGLHNLGHDVYFFEDSNDWPACYHPGINIFDSNPGEGLASARYTFGTLGLGDRWVYYDAHTSTWLGPLAGQAIEICRTADLLINVSAWANNLRPWLMDIPVRVFVDTDPAFTQIDHLTKAASRQNCQNHTSCWSFGENIGQRNCQIPDDGLQWKSTRQPVVLDAWPVTAPPEDGAFTTVMFWETYPAREYEGKYYGSKCDSFEAFGDLPMRTSSGLEIAVARVPEEVRHQLLSNGWRIVNPLQLSRNVDSYRAYIQRSKAEFSVAKHGYVVSRSGWFSERTAIYLTSGRPALVQDTGFTEWLPTGLGVVAFRTREEALAGVDEINSRYQTHCRAAREIAAEYFDARKVLSALVEGAMNRTGTGAPAPAVLPTT